MKLSIVIPIYNMELYIERCLSSILSSKSTAIEVICINDGSNDSTLEIINSKFDDDIRLKVINQKNKGVSSARNKGIEISTGEYVWFIDPDDWLEKNAINIVLNTIDSCSSQIYQFEFRHRFNCSSKNYVQAFNLPKNEILKKDKIENILFDSITLTHELSSVCNKVYSKKLLSNVKFDEASSFGEDFYFNCKVIEIAESFYHKETCVYNYDRSREGSLSKFKNANSFYTNEYQVYNYRLIFRRKWGLDINLLNEMYCDLVVSNLKSEFKKMVLRENRFNDFLYNILMCSELNLFCLKRTKKSFIWYFPLNFMFILISINNGNKNV